MRRCFWAAKGAVLNGDWHLSILLKKSIAEKRIFQESVRTGGHKIKKYYFAFRKKM